MSFMLKKTQDRMNGLSAQGIDPLDRYGPLPMHSLPSRPLLSLEESTSSDFDFLKGIEKKNLKLRDMQWK